MNCIYCKNEIIGDNQSDEHVFPKAFGCPDDWILNCVCQKCNNYFGGTIERYLAGDSIEGLWRLQKIGSHSKKHILQTRIKINVPDEKQYDEFRGAILFADFAKKDCLYLPPQILIFGSSGERTFVLLDKTSDEEIRNIKKIALFAHNEKEWQQAAGRLKQIGMKFDEDKINRLPQTCIGEDGKLEVVIEGVMDAVIFRAIAKIGFNYLAKVMDAQYVLNSKFDAIRNYIKTGIKPNFRPVEIKNGHILPDETDSFYYFEGHIFIIETKGNKIISKISLTNMSNFYYVVNLGDVGLTWHNIKRGHAYSFEKNKILPMFRFPISLLTLRA